MRRPLLWASLLLLLLAAGAEATEFPYVAYISSDDVYIRSGPGKNYYPTAKMKRGEPVEVYRHDPGGWYAIRPPVQSFSWISARQLDVLDDGLASVNTERAVARVGSLFSEVRDVIQVRLNKNERVELVDTHASGDEKWYKIAPPAGEFRWVYKDYVTGRAPQDELADDDRTTTTPKSGRAGTLARQRRRDDDIRLTSVGRDSDGDRPTGIRTVLRTDVRRSGERPAAPGQSPGSGGRRSQVVHRGAGRHRSRSVGDGGRGDYDLVVQRFAAADRAADAAGSDGDRAWASPTTAQQDRSSSTG